MDSKLQPETTQTIEFTNQELQDLSDALRGAKYSCSGYAEKRLAKLTQRIEAALAPSIPEYVEITK